MARRAAVRAPTAASIPDTLRIPSTTSSLVRALGRLSRSSLLDLVLQWLDEKNIKLFPPYLSPPDGGGDDNEDTVNPYTAADSLEELRTTYEELRSRKGGKREVIDRILEGDWRHGISLRQLAMVDMRYIEDHPLGQRWTALQLVKTSSAAPSSGRTGDIFTPLPRFHASTFVEAIHREVSPLVKAHYHIYRSKTLPLTFVRIFVIDSPYQQPRQSPYVYTDSSRVILLAFPDSSPFVYSSLFSSGGARSAVSVGTDTATLRRIVRDAIPKALSRPHHRYVLKSTALTTKSLFTLLSLRGPGRTNSANGAFNVFADAVVEGQPLDPRPPQSVAPETYIHGNNRTNREKHSVHGDENEENQHQPSTKSGLITKTKRHPLQSKITLPSLDPDIERVTKKRKITTSSRFGTTGTNVAAPIAPSLSLTGVEPPPSGQTSVQAPALDRLHIRLLDPPIPPLDDTANEDDEGDNELPATASLTFNGTNVIAGLRQLAEIGLVDAARMPSWMTGEEGVSSAVIRKGRRKKEKD